MFTIELDTIQLPFHGGYYETEQRVTQMLHFDIKMEVDSKVFLTSPELENTVDYTTILPILKEVSTNGSQLLEDMACQSVRKIKASSELISRVEVRIGKKPHLGCANDGVRVSYSE